jgi:hypothetical protein
MRSKELPQYTGTATDSFPRRSFRLCGSTYRNSPAPTPINQHVMCTRQVRPIRQGEEPNLTASISVHLPVEHLVPKVHCHRAGTEQSATGPERVRAWSTDHARTPLIGVVGAGIAIDLVAILQ